MRIFLIVLDGVGIGELPDAEEFGDRGASTLPHVAEAVDGLRVPNLERLGLGRLCAAKGVRAVAEPRAAHGRMAERSKGKDSTTGHWEIAGLVLERPFPTFPNGFPVEWLERWSARVGRGWIGNVAASGTEIIQRLGAEHERSGDFIVYTSADSVFQIAAHERVVSIEELYSACAAAREMLTGALAVGRVIARPFEGEAGRWQRTPRRRDFSLAPPAETLLDRLHARGTPVITVGKVDELFAKRGVSDAIHTRDNSEGEAALLDLARKSGEGLVFANLVDFDQQYGHRNDAPGFARALERFDETLGPLLGRLRGDELCVVTADHGNDPTTPGTDHTREYVPLLVAGARVHSTGLGTRETFADLGVTLAELFGAGRLANGTSFLREMRA